MLSGARNELALLVLNHDYTEEDEEDEKKETVRKTQKINSSFNNCSFSFLNHDYTEEDEKDELKVFLFILIIFFSVIMVQKIE